MIFNTLAKKLIIMFLGITFLTILVVAFISYKSVFPELMRETEDHYIYAAVHMMDSIDNVMASNYEHNYVYGKNPSLLT